jgi:hypothetical protein
MPEPDPGAELGQPCLHRSRGLETDPLAVPWPATPARCVGVAARGGSSNAAVVEGGQANLHNRDPVDDTLTGEPELQRCARSVSGTSA